MGHGRDFNLTLGMVGLIALAGVMLQFSLPLLAFEMSGAGSDLALIKGAGFVPNILFAIFIGVINDRLLKARAFRRYSAALVAITLALAVAHLTDRISLTGLVVYTILLHGLNYAIGNAQNTLIRLTVPHENLSDATALTSTVYTTISTIAPAIGGFALFSLGHGGVIWLCAGLMLLASALSSRVNPAETLPPPQPFGPALVEGWHVFTANRELVMMTVVIVLTNAAEGAFATALILKLKAAGANDFQIGLILAAAGVGAVLASRIAAPARRRFGYRTAFFWPIWGLAALYLAMMANAPLWIIGALSFIEGGLSLFFAIGIWSYRQESTDAAHMGRIAGLTGAIFKIGMPPVIILAGLLADAGSLTPVFIAAALINAAAAIFLATVARWGVPGLYAARD